ncbi:Serine/threonine-protein kinase PrkC [Poriferisphaera corsica]|uniref:Serine/threonine-protein kinase PrkC n=1 Tax=Poriferisphaera corsica TaxID=2528020 RepID=A0A517YV05_9BACT|nr:serine/threonine-protein kinase [Poriferisphaera corsica]QDU34035.1 Serine/threonine-protein kinase PrkC [Poriferisphaera corsica]
MNSPDFKKPQLSPLNPGDRVGAYTIIEQIGSGGSSIVFKAQDTLLKNIVAVKHIMLDPASDDEHLRHRVQQEISIHKQVTSDLPNFLVKMIDFIDDPRGIFIVMEYIDGPSLEQMLTMSTMPMPLRQALGIIAGTAVALNHIHSKGIIHRDLKPANIMLPRTGGLKLTDFGLATVIAEQETMSLGSARYMAPEMLSGQNLDVRSDIYSLGLIAYESIIGRSNFEIAFRPILRDNRNQALRWMKWHTNNRAQIPAINQFMPDMDPKIGEFINRLLAKEPDKRIPTTVDLLNAIRMHFLELNIPDSMFDQNNTIGHDTPVSTAHDTAPLPQVGKRYKILASILGIVALSGIATGIILYNKQSYAFKKKISTSTELIESAQQHYNSGNFDSALNFYRTVSNDWGVDSKLGRKAKSGINLSKGQIALREKNFNDAIVAFKQALVLEGLDKRQINQLIEEAKKRRDFYDAVNRIERDITELRLPQAQATLEQWRDLSLTTEETDLIKELEIRLGDQRLQIEVTAIIKEAEKLVAIGRRDQAIRELEIAKSRISSSQLRQQYENLLANASYDLAIIEAQRAEADNQYGKAVESYMGAYNIKKSDDLRDKINQLQSRSELEKGLLLMQEGDYKRAKTALLSSLGYKKNAAANEALKRIDAEDQYQLFMQAGQKAMNEVDFEVAMNHFKQAVDLRPTEAANEQYTEASIFYWADLCKEALRNRDLDKAQSIIAKTEAIDSLHEQIDPLREQFSITSEYLKFLNTGDKQRQNSRFSEAKINYRKAAKIMKTVEIDTRLQDIEFEHLLAKARALILIGDRKNSLAVLQTASEIQTTPELHELMRQVLIEDEKQ